MVVGGASMSVENFFSVEVRFFCLRLGRCLWSCMVFRGLFTFVLRCASAWFVVRFDVATGAHCQC